MYLVSLGEHGEIQLLVLVPNISALFILEGLWNVVFYIILFFSWTKIPQGTSGPPSWSEEDDGQLYAGTTQLNTDVDALVHSRHFKETQASANPMMCLCPYWDVERQVP